MDVFFGLVISRVFHYSKIKKVQNVGEGRKIDGVPVTQTVSLLEKRVPVAQTSYWTSSLHFHALLKFPLP